MQHRLISIIVPVFNVREYLDRCLQSLVSQVYRNIEIILIDDGSSDGSSKLCDDWCEKDARIKVIHTENRGVSFARNTGLDYAQGEYLCFADADDYVSRNYVSTMYRSLITNGADIAMTGYYFSSGDTFRDTKETSQVEIYTYKEIIQEYILHSKFMDGVVCKLFPRSIIDNFRFDTKIRIAEDALFTHLVLEKCKTIVYKDDKLYCYYIRSGSATNSVFDERYLECKYVIDFIYERQRAMFPEMDSLFYKSKVMSYCRKIQDSLSDNSQKSKKIRNQFLCEVKSSSCDKLWKYCNTNEKIRYILIKHHIFLLTAYEYAKNRIMR